MPDYHAKPDMCVGSIFVLSIDDGGKRMITVLRATRTGFSRQAS